MTTTNSVPDETRFGLKPTTISAICSVFGRYPELEQAIIYGSRAKGTYRDGSDIDLTLVGDALSYTQLNRIETEIDDLLLPYMMDLSLYSQINNVELKEHIRRVGQLFYQRG